MGKLSRNKGATWERKVANFLRPIFGDEVIYRGHQTSSGGVDPWEGCDVEGTPLWLEAKHAKLTNPRAALRQCEEVQERAKDPRPPVVISKDDKPPPGWRVGIPRSPALATMRLGDFLVLLEDWRRLKLAAGEDVVLPRSSERCR